MLYSVFDFKFNKIKEDIYEECKKLNLTKEQSNLVYDYYHSHKAEFMINEKVLLEIDDIVRIIINKINILSP